MKAELREKKLGKKTGYLKYWVPEVNDLKEITISIDGFDEDGKLNKIGKQKVRNHLEQMTEEPEKPEIKEDEREMSFEP